MLLRQGDARSDAVDHRLGWTLAAVAGAVNTVVFQAIGFFAANMTGNVSLSSDRFASGRWQAGVFFLAILACFIIGAAAATLLTNSGHRRQQGGIYAYGILLEALLMTTLTYLCLSLPPASQATLLALGLSFLMGFQNAVVTRISDARVRTTHVSGMSTDIGIELASLFDIARGAGQRQHAPSLRSGLRLHSQTLVAFLIGGAAGILVYRGIGIGVLFVAAGILLTMALHAIWRHFRQIRSLRIDQTRP